jgi:redox-sensitive bicupin YhaK (pirin superfamily)
MITVRKSAERRHVQSRTQNTWMTFDPENDVDPFRRGFHGLESLNEEHLAPEMGLHPHAHENIDFITYVREGAIIHQDDVGTFGRMEAGEFQRRNVPSRMKYHAVNGSIAYTAQVFQGGLKPDSLALWVTPEQKRFYTAERTGTLRLVASQGGRQDSLSLAQDVRVYSSILLQGNHLVHEFEGGRTAWLHVVKGRILLQDQFLKTGDGVALVDEVAASFTAQEPSEVLLFDLT